MASKPLPGYGQHREAPEFTITQQPWAVDALCAQTDPELFFPEKGGNQSQEAKKVCGNCEVLFECLGYALDHDDYGVWGGMTRMERREFKRKREVA